MPTKKSQARTLNSDQIIICGHRKSGTSLFLNLLDNHPDLAVYPTDINYYYAYFPQYVRSEVSDAARKSRIERVVFTELEKTLESWELTDVIDVPRFRNQFFTEIRGHLDDIAAITAAFQTAYKDTMNLHGLPFVMKESSIEIYASEIMKSHPNTRFVHLIRDPRDNFAALKAGVEAHYSRLGEGAHATLSSLLHRARLGFQYAIVNQQLYGKDRYHVVKFEDLLGDTDATLTTLCNFLNLAPNETLKTPTKLGFPTKGNSYDGMDFSALSARNVGRWMERIEPEEAQTIEFHFGGLMEHFGYAHKFSSEDQSRAAADFYKWANYKYYFSDRFS